MSDKTSWACSTDGGDEKWIQNFSLKIWRENQVVRPRRWWKDNIKIGLQNLVGGCGLDKMQWRAVHGNEPSGSINAGNVLTNWATVRFSSYSGPMVCVSLLQHWYRGFLVYLTTLFQLHRFLRRVVGWSWTMNWEIYGRKWSWSFLRCYPNNASRNLGMPRRASEESVFEPRTSRI
jgi:hypothetical protein